MTKDADALHAVIECRPIKDCLLQTGDWVVTLEGLHRLRIGKVNISYPREYWVTMAAAVDDVAEAPSKYVPYSPLCRP